MDDQPIARVFDALPIKTGDFTLTELWEAIKSTQGNKANGLDSIPAEVWKLVCFNDQLLELLSCHGDITYMWLKGAILPFPKKGDLDSASDYRGITLMAVGAKICLLFRFLSVPHEQAPTGEILKTELSAWQGRSAGPGSSGLDQRS